MQRLETRQDAAARTASKRETDERIHNSRAEMKRSDDAAKAAA